MHRSLRPVLAHQQRIVPRRCYYTVIPSTPFQQHRINSTRMEEEDSSNPIHALYNNENQSILETQSKVSSKVHVPASEYVTSSDVFSPTFNTIFDE